MLEFRAATPNEIERIAALELVAHNDQQRRSFIWRAVAEKSCSVAVAEGVVVAYGVLEYSFFNNGFIALLYVEANYRRRGVGLELMRYLESICESSKLFTSTNLSNLPMQSLLAKLGYSLSGVIHHLDPDDPELVYFKRLNG